MTSARLLLLIVSLSGGATRSSAQSPNAGFLEAFDRADREAQAVVGAVRCALQVGAARSRGLFGPVDSLGRSGHCIVVDGSYVGLFNEADSQITHVKRLSAVDLSRNARRSAPLDTGLVLALERAELAAQMRGAPPYSTADRPYAPVSFRFDGDSIEVWLVPASIFRGPPSVGGERGYIYSPDGRTLAREIDSFNEYRTIAVADSGNVTISSRQEELPLLSELVVANLLNAGGRTATIETRRRMSVLSGQGGRAVWLQIAR